jgi:hypothetical protein
LSPDALLLRSLKRELSAIQVRMNRDETYSHQQSDRDWHGLMQGQIKPLEARMLARPPATWADCVELAEICWWGVAHPRGLNANVVSAGRARVFDDEDPRDALVDAVLSLGGGERFYPQGHARSSA